MKGKKDRFKYVGVFVCTLFLFTAGLEKVAGSEEVFPARPVNMIVPAPAGGGTDTIGRLLGAAAEPILGQKVVILNKPGASGTIGTVEIVKANPDGYTIGCLWASPLTTVPFVLKVPYTLDDFTYITMAARTAVVFCVLSEFPARNAEEFFEYARKNKLTYATDGIGTSVHFSGQKIFNAMGVKFERLVPHRGAAESIKALLGGHVDVYGGSISTALPHIRAGKVRALFVASAERSGALPDAWGVSELGHPEAETLIWRGILGPKGIPADRRKILEMAFRQAAESQKLIDILKKKGEEPVASSGEEFEKAVRMEVAGNTRVAKQLGLSPE